MRALRRALLPAFRLLLSLGLLTAAAHWSSRVPPDASALAGSPGARVVTRQASHRDEPFARTTYNAARENVYVVLMGDGFDPLSWVVELDPATGATDRSFAVPSLPLVLTVDPSGQYLYADNAMSNPSSPVISRLNLDTGLVDFAFSPVMTATAQGAALTAIVPVPGQPDTVIVADNPWYTSYTELRVYDQGVQRPVYFPFNLPLTDLAFDETGALLGRDTSVNNPQLLRLDLQADGLHLRDTIPLPQEVATVAMTLHEGAAYFADGRVIDLATRTLVRRYELPRTGSAVSYDPIRDRVHILLQRGDTPSLFSARGPEGLGTVALPGLGGVSPRMVRTGADRVVIEDVAAGGLWFYTLAERPYVVPLPCVLH